ncbi:MAG: hypothetical protein ACPHXR_06015, partial [Flavicella sp.]
MKLLKPFMALYSLALFSIVSCEEANLIEEIDCTSLPTFSAGAASDITDVSATLNGTVESPTRDPSILSQGFVYSTTELPTVTESNIIKANGVDISKEALNLYQNTDYYYRAYYTNLEGTYYGPQSSFTTGVGSALSNINYIDNVSAIAANVYVQITSTGGGEISAQGVCWSTNEEPTIADAKTEDSLEG